MSSTSDAHNTIRTCPSCGSDEILRSRRRGLDHLLALANLYPYRCRHYSCERRFYGFGNNLDPTVAHSPIATRASSSNVVNKHPV
jgi:ssDNA-binding Zn-finger/Zn-ribbon topoisomerase 1